MLAYLLPDPAAPVLIPRVPEIFSDNKIFHVAEVYQWCWLEESGLWLENGDRTFVVLTSGKPLLQNKQVGGQTTSNIPKNGNLIRFLRHGVFVP